MTTREIRPYEQPKDAPCRSWQFLRSCYPTAILMRKPDSKSLVVVRTLLPLPAQALVLTAGGSPSLTYEISKIDQHIQTL